jgi:hypothetical protein
VRKEGCRHSEGKGLWSQLLKNLETKEEQCPERTADTGREWRLDRVLLSPSEIRPKGSFRKEYLHGGQYELWK